MRLTRRDFGVWILSAAALAAQQNGERKRPDVPYVPTSPQAVEAMLKLAGVTKADTVYDLGCGDGRIVVSAAKNFGAHAVGIDIDPQRLKEANENVRQNGVENLVKIVDGDLFTADIHDATVVTLFLLTSVNQKLKPKLLQDLKPGTRVVSNTFDMGDWKPEKEIDVENASDSDYFSRKLYLWIVPKR